MKKLFAILLAALMMASVFAGCGGAKEANLTDVLETINKDFPEATKNLTKLTDVKELNTYYEINTDDVKQFAGEINTNASTAPVEIVVVEGNDSSAAENIKTALERRYQKIYSTYSSYSAEEFDMVKDCGVTTEGNYVTMIVASDYKGILDKVNEAVK